MGMGYGAAKCVCIKYEDLKELCPEEMQAIETHSNFETWGSLAYDNWMEEAEFFKPLIESLVKKFEEATTVDGKSLTLYLTWYDEEQGDRYDEVEHKDNCIFELDNVYQLSAPAQS